MRFFIVFLLAVSMFSCGHKEKVQTEQLKKIDEANKQIAERTKQAMTESLPQAVYEKYTAKPVITPNLIEPVKSRIYGNKTARNKIVMLSDFACGHCGIASKELRSRVDENKSLVNLTYVFYPLDGRCNPFLKGHFTDYSCVSIKLMLCAEKQGKVWPAIDFLYANQNDGNKNLITADQLADKMEKQLGLKDLKKCVTSDWLNQRLKKEHEVYANMSVPGTPFVLLNNRQIGGVYKFRDSFGEFIKIVDSKSRPLKENSNRK
ncbi:MAG: thioredoxin domain-containing protein [Pseudomonadota bacterium]